MDNEQHDLPPSYEGHGHAPIAPMAYTPGYFPNASFSQPHRHVANPPIISAQPRLMTSLTGPSRATLQNMEQRNPEARNHLNGLLGNLASNMEIRAAQDISRMAANWTADGLVSSILLPEEEASDGHLLHVGAWIKDESGAIQQKLPTGRVIVTNKRLLFVSCGTNQESALTPERETGAYAYFSLSTAATDAISFSPVPLKSIRSVMFSAEATSKWVAQIKGLLSCLALCTQNGHVTNWSHGHPYQVIDQHRIIRIGAVLPPFEKTVVIDIYLDPSLALRTAIDFATKLQRYVPE